MDLNDGLYDSLKAHLDWGKPRLECFVGMLLGLLRLKQVNLTQLAVGFASDTDIKSRYRRLQRFFAGVYFDYDAIARLQMQLFDFPRQKYYLTLDRTNWQWGKTDINILTLGVVYKGSAIPVYWLVLNKQGNSNQGERIALLKRFVSQFGRDGIQGILGDREFIGGQWWGWLKQQRIPYVMRLRENQLMLDHKGVQQAVRTRFRDLKRGERRQLRKTCQISGQWVWLSAMRLDDDELLLLASNRRYPDPFVVYSLRWEIENLFQSLKGRGFHWEDTRITKYFRIKKIMALLAIAFSWAHKVGEWKHGFVKPLLIKKHGRPEQSLFRYGLDHLTDHLLHGFRAVAENLRLWMLFLWPPNLIAKANGNVTLLLKTAD
jgi:hypothetical protein